MNKKFVVGAIIILAIGIGALFLFRNYIGLETSVGGDRDSEGCLISAGYSFDEKVGACTRDFELTADIKQAAQMAVEKVGRSYALTVVSFNSYEEVGSYDITLERGLDCEKITVYIKGWKIVPEFQSSQTTEQTI